MFENFFPKVGELFSTYGKLLLSGLQNTLIIAVCGFIIGLVIGTIIASVKVSPKKNFRNPVARWIFYIVEKIFDIYVTVVRGTPVVVQLLLMYFAILAQAGLPALYVAIIVFGLNSGAYMSEIIRGGILSIDKGQMEAGRSLGMSYVGTMTRVVLPQSVKNITPTLINEFIALLKETSVAGYITVIDVTMVTQRIVAREYEALVPYLVLAFIYLVIVLLFTMVAKLLERRLRKSDRPA